jgi:hypothetical protein
MDKCITFFNLGRLDFTLKLTSILLLFWIYMELKTYNDAGLTIWTWSALILEH